MNIVELATEAARAQGARAIESIELEVGVLAGVLPEALEFCFEAAARHTLAQDAQLKIHSVPVRGTCLACGSQCDMASLVQACPQCGGSMLNLTQQGRDLRILAITIEE